VAETDTVANNNDWSKLEKDLDNKHPKAQEKDSDINSEVGQGAETGKVEEEATTRVTIEEIPDDAADTQNDKLIKMLKQIDTQTLKRRLSLDKLDNLDTDDEVSVDEKHNKTVNSKLE
jgi:hypothetical protein